MFDYFYVAVQSSDLQRKLCCNVLPVGPTRSDFDILHLYNHIVVIVFFWKRISFLMQSYQAPGNRCQWDQIRNILQPRKHLPIQSQQ